MQWESQVEKIKAGDRKTLARLISVIENQQEGYISLLEKLPMGPSLYLVLRDLPVQEKAH